MVSIKWTSEHNMYEEFEFGVLAFLETWSRKWNLKIYLSYFEALIIIMTIILSESKQLTQE